MMKHLYHSISVVVLVTICAATSVGQIKSDTLSIREIQEVPMDSLLIGNENSPRTGDTVTVTGTVVAAARRSPGGPMLFALGNAATIYIVDENGGAWSGLNVRATDSVAASSTLLTAVDTGFVITITGVVTQYYTTTQFEIGKIASWNADKQVEVIDTKPNRPDPTEIMLTDLVNGAPTAKIPASQQWEGAYVVIRNLSTGTVSKNSSTGRYTWTVTDGAGNSIGVYDQSVYFRGGSQGFNPDWAPPVPGTQISHIRGIITSSNQGIVIAPIYPGDLSLSSFPPTITTVRHAPAFPTSTEPVTVNASVETAKPGGSISEVTLAYGIDATELGTVSMTYDGATKEAQGVIPQQADGSAVWYKLSAKDNTGESVEYPGAASKSLPFYIVRDGALRIRDVQFTPFSDGLPGCVGATVTLRGTVVSQADTTSLGLVYIQDARASWSGIMVRGDATVRGLKLGEDVTVRGVVAEGYSSSTAGNTAVIDAVVVEKHGTAAVPDPVELTTGLFKTGVVTDGTPSAEEWEGMLLRFRGLTVTARNADEGAGFYGEFLVDDGSGGLRVDDLGQWKTVYTNDTSKTNLIMLEAGTTIQSLTGVMFFSFGNYKLQPRNIADFDGVTGLERIAAAPDLPVLRQNYPNPVNAGNPTVIGFGITEPGRVSMQVFDALGRRVATVLDSHLDGGLYSIRFDTESLPAGAYVYRLSAAGRVASGRMIIR